MNIHISCLHFLLFTMYMVLAFVYGMLFFIIIGLQTNILVISVDIILIIEIYIYLFLSCTSHIFRIWFILSAIVYYFPVFIFIDKWFWNMVYIYFFFMLLCSFFLVDFFLHFYFPQCFDCLTWFKSFTLKRRFIWLHVTEYQYKKTR